MSITCLTANGRTAAAVPVSDTPTTSSYSVHSQQTFNEAITLLQVACFHVKETPSMDKLSDYLRISDAADYLGVSPNTLRNWENAGKIVAHRHLMSQLVQSSWY